MQSIQWVRSQTRHLRRPWHVLAVVFLVMTVTLLYQHNDNASVPLDIQRTIAQQFHTVLRSFQRNQDGVCQPKINVGFLKTPKCASTTIQNILYRYALVHNLTIAMPEKGTQFSPKLPFNASSIANAPWRSLGYNMFAQHSVWSHQELQKILPADAVYISSVRDPIQRFKSSFYFYGRDKKQTLEEHVMSKSTKPDSVMMQKFGLPNDKKQDSDAIYARIKQIERQFDLILVAERLDESLVLLKHLLCWTTEDMVTLHLKNHMVDHTADNLSPTARLKLLHAFKADYQLYNRMAAIFEQRVDQFGEERMKRELEELRAARDRVIGDCQIEQVNSSELKRNDDFRMFADKQITVYGYLPRVHSERCQSLAYADPQFAILLRDRQLQWIQQSAADSAGSSS